MKLSKLIAQLQATQAESGDVEVVYNADIEGLIARQVHAINVDTVSDASELESCYDQCPDIAVGDDVIILF